MRAIISVYDKQGVVELARVLVDLGWNLLATGNTAAALRQASIPHTSVEEFTSQPEILGGRVKTLHPAIHGGILAKREPGQLIELQRAGFQPIDMVVSNLYPFVETARRSSSLPDVLEQIDVGGVTLTRAAAKNFEHVVVLTHPDQYPGVLDELRATGRVALETRRRLAARAFESTAAYDAQIALYFRREEIEPFPPSLVLPLRKIQDLRYGENPHQQAAFYAQDGFEQSASLRANLAHAEQLRGKDLSFTNLLDADAALSVVEEFQAPTIVLIKHTNPCGVASRDELADAFADALASDPVAAYGCVLAANRHIDEAAARAMRHHFMDIILAPDYTEEAMRILSRKSKDLRLLKLPIRQGPPPSTDRDQPSWIPADELDLQRIHGGMLAQTPDNVHDGDLRFLPVSERRPTPEELVDLTFAWRAVRHVKSNSVVLAKNRATVGIGAGQQSRVIAAEIAVKLAGDRARGAVMATDGFFPFPDGIEVGAKAGVTAIIHPGGGVREQDGIAAANAYGVALVTTGGLRYFKH